MRKGRAEWERVAESQRGTGGETVEGEGNREVDGLTVPLNKAK